jgi:hypothetical protein
MEASGAGLAASGDGGSQQSDGAAAGGGSQDGQGQQQGQSQQGLTDAAIQQFTDTLSGVSDQQESMRQFLESQQQPPAEQQEQPTPPDLSFLDENAPGFDPAVAAQRLQEVMRSEAGAEAQKQLKAELDPIRETVSNMQRQQEADTLVAEFPELGKEETAKAVVSAAETQAAIMGMPQLAANTAFVRQVYLAGRATELAQQQQGGAASASGVATLEGAGGASPGGAQQGAERTAESMQQKWAGRSNVLAKL